MNRRAQYMHPYSVKHSGNFTTFSLIGPNDPPKASALNAKMLQQFELVDEGHLSAMPRYHKFNLPKRN